MNLGLRAKLMIAFLLLSLTIVGAQSIFYYRFAETTLTDNANARLLDAAQQTSNDIETFIEQNLDAVRAEAQLPVFVDYLENLSAVRADRGLTQGGEVAAEALALQREAETALRALRDKDRTYITSYALLDRKGIDVADTILFDVGEDRSNREYFQLAVETGLPYVSPVRFDANTGEGSMYFSSPVLNAEEEIIGVLCARYHAVMLQRLIAQSNGLAGSGSFAILLDENYIIRAHGARPNLAHKSIVPLAPIQIEAFQAAYVLPQEGSAENFSLDLHQLAAGLDNIDQQPVFVADTFPSQASGGAEQGGAVRMESLPWLVVFEQPRDVFLTPINVQARNTLFLAFLVATAAALIAFWIARLLALPLARLTEAAEVVAGGNLNVTVAVETRDEIGVLARTFNSMTQRLRATLAGLEHRVAERTQELEQRSHYLQASAEVGSAATSILDPNHLIEQVVGLIREQFNLYYVGLFVVDDRGEWAELRAGTGQAGQAMLARQHRLHLDESSMIGWSIVNRQPRVAQDVELDAVRRATSELPDTRAEAALPLRARGQVIGALSVQSTEHGIFDQDTLRVLQTMADQVGAALENARLFAQNQEALEATSRVYGELSRQAWREFLQGQPDLGVRSDSKGVYTLAGEQGIEPSGWNGTPRAGGEARTPLSMPITSRGGVIGKLETYKPGEAEWTPEELGLLEEIADRLAQALDGARLYRDTQRLAVREQLIGEVTARIRAEVEIEALLQRTVQELGHALGAKRAIVQLEVEE